MAPLIAAILALIPVPILFGGSAVIPGGGSAVVASSFESQGAAVMAPTTVTAIVVPRIGVFFQ